MVSFKNTNRPKALHKNRLFYETDMKYTGRIIMQILFSALIHCNNYTCFVSTAKTKTLVQCSIGVRAPSVLLLSQFISDRCRRQRERTSKATLAIFFWMEFSRFVCSRLKLMPQETPQKISTFFKALSSEIVLIHFIIYIPFDLML